MQWGGRQWSSDRFGIEDRENTYFNTFGDIKLYMVALKVRRVQLRVKEHTTNVYCFGLLLTHGNTN
jgi:hypothetical protein